MVIAQAKDTIENQNGQNVVVQKDHTLEVFPISSLNETIEVKPGHWMTIQHYWSRTKEHEQFTLFTCADLGIKYMVPKLYRLADQKFKDLVADFPLFCERCKKAQCTIISE